MEFKRVLLGKPFLVLLAALLLLNLWLFRFQNTDDSGNFGAYAGAYNQTVGELSSLDWEEGLAWCDRFDQEMLAALFSDGHIEDADAVKWQAVRQIREQFAHLADYGDYLNRIRSEAERLQSVSLFSKPGTFAYENVVKTAADFEALEGIRVTFGHDLAVTEALEDQWTDVMVLLPVILVCGLFLADRKDGLRTMLYAAPGGRGRLAAKRVLILLIASFTGVILLLGQRILLYGRLYDGLGEWDRALQSIPMFYNVPVPMTVGGFWLRYLLVKAAGAFFLGLVLWLILSAISNLPLALAAAGIVLGAEYAMTAIPSSSVFAVFRYVNVLSYINYLPVMTRYLNLSVFGWLISGDDLVCILLPILCAAFAVLNGIVAEKKYPLTAASRFGKGFDSLRRWFDRLLSRGGLFAQEAKKLLFHRKGLLILLVLMLLLTQTGVPYRDEGPYDMYLTYYTEKYAGPVTAETVGALEAELAASEESERTGALLQLLDYARSHPEDGWIVPASPYDALFTTQQYHTKTAMIALLFLILLVASIRSQERQSDMEPLLWSTPAGRGKLWRRKQALLLICAAAVWAIVYGGEIWKLTDRYGAFSCFGAPADTVTMLALREWNAALGQVLVLLYGLRLVVLLAAAEVCFFLSGLCRKNTDAILTCCAVLVLPAAVAAIGSGIGEKLSILVSLVGIDVLPALQSCLLTAVAGLAAALLSARRGIALSALRIPGRGGISGNERAGDHPEI